VTLESGSPLASKAALFFSISYEEDLFNLVRMLHGSGVEPLRARRLGRPLVIAGGPAVSANPYPFAEIADALALGEGEGTLPAIIGVFESQGGGEGSRWNVPDPELILRELARTPGILVPGSSPAVAGFNAPAALSRFPRSAVVTPESTFPDTLLVESSRGCPGSCAFCVATALYRPFRFMPLASFEELVSSLPAGVTRIGLVSTAVAANPDFAPIVRLLVSRGISVSFSSLRAEDLDDESMDLIGAIGTASVSLAPESGSEPLRYALGKRVPDEVYLRAAAKLRGAGVGHFTLYLLIGCPGETGGELAETRDFMERFRSAIGGRSFSVHVNPLVPKPWTPFQFHAMPEEGALVERQKEMEKLLRGLGIAVQTKSVRSALRQALLSTGDESAGRAVVHHIVGGLSWRKALAEAGVNERFPHEKKGPETSFPWDGVSGPVRRGSLFKRFEALGRPGP